MEEEITLAIVQFIHKHGFEPTKIYYSTLSQFLLVQHELKFKRGAIQVGHFRLNIIYVKDGDIDTFRLSI